MNESKYNQNAVAKRAGGFSGQGAGSQQQRVNINYGHNGTHVVVIYSQAISNQVLTEEETEAAIAALQQALRGLRDHKAGKPPAESERILVGGNEALNANGSGEGKPS